MTGMFFTLLKKDFRLMLSARFFLLAAGSLVLYSCYIHFVYVSLDDKMYPVYCYDPAGIGAQAIDSITAQDSGRTLPPVKNVNTKEELADACSDGYSIGIDLSEKTPRIRMVSCGIDTICGPPTRHPGYPLSALTGLSRFGKCFWILRILPPKLIRLPHRAQAPPSSAKTVRK